MHTRHTQPTFQGFFAELCARKAGKQVPIDVFNKTQARRTKLDQQTHDIAQKLERQGIQAYQENDLTLVGLHSGLSKQLDNFRNIIFLPSVAQMRRAPEVKFVQYCLQDYPKARNWTITSGPRVVIPKREDCIFEHKAGIERVRVKFKEMTRKVSKLNSEDFMKRAGVEFSYWTKEFGEVVETDEGLSVHPHLHAVLILKRGRMQKHAWSKLLERIQAYLGAYSKDCGIIQNPREFVKYCVKPDDLTELSDSSVADLYQVTRHMRMQQPLGVFRRVKRKLKANDLSLTWLDGKLVTMRRTKREGLSKKDKPWQPPNALRDAEPVVVARIEPAPVFAPITEPMLLVHGLAGRNVADWVAKDEGTQQLLADIRLHTKSLIVRRERRERIQKYESEPKIPPKLASAHSVL